MTAKIRSRLKNRKAAIAVILLLILGTGLVSLLYEAPSDIVTGREAAVPPPGGLRGIPPAESPAPGRQPEAVAEQPIAPLQQTPADRMVVTTASVKINVTSVNEGVANLRRIVESMDGFVTDSSIEPIPKGRFVGGGILIQPSVRATLTIRVPSNQLDRVISQISSLGELLSLSTNSRDVTEQYSDTNARLKNAQAALEQYKEIMKTAKTTADVLQTQQRIDAVQEQIEVLTAQIKRLQNQVSLATITVSLVEPQIVEKSEDEDGTLLDRLLLEPLLIALSFAEIVFRGVIILVVGLFPVYTIGGVGYFTYKRLWKKPKRDNQKSESPPSIPAP
jgi:hypothetical protein